MLMEDLANIFLHHQCRKNDTFKVANLHFLHADLQAHALPKSALTRIHN
jgi:hypothetical protein